MISFGGFGGQGYTTFLQLDIAWLSGSDSNSSKPASEEHPGHCRVKLLHLQVGNLAVQAGELFPVCQELSLPLHSELGPDLCHVFKLHIHKADSFQLCLQILKRIHTFKENEDFEEEVTMYSFPVGR